MTSETWTWMRKWTLSASPAHAARLVLGTFQRENPNEATLPVPVVNLARWMGAEVVYGEPRPFEIRANRIPAITVGYNDLVERQRFAVAHEIGHLVLHPEGAYHGGSPTHQAEQEANEFAMELLMPEPWVAAEAWAKDTNTSRLASVFRVSEVLVFGRLKMLGLA